MENSFARRNLSRLLAASDAPPKVKKVRLLVDGDAAPDESSLDSGEDVLPGNPLASASSTEEISDFR
jgi:hypothetical protein